MTTRISYTVGPNGRAPFKNRLTDAGWDLYASEDVILVKDQTMLVGTEVCFGMQEGWVGIIKERSGLATKGIEVHAGVVDSEYRGEIKIVMKLYAGKEDTYYITAGDKIAQIIFLPLPITELIRKDTLDETTRGDTGFGASGK